MAKWVPYSFLCDWPDESEIETVAVHLSDVGSDFSVEGRKFRNDIRAMAAAFGGDGQPELADSGQGVAAFAEAVRAMSELLAVEMSLFAGRRGSLEAKREKAVTLAAAYNSGTPVNRFWEFHEIPEGSTPVPGPQLPLGPSVPLGPVVFFRLAEEPFESDPAQIPPNGYTSRLSEWRTTPGIENAAARHTVPGRALGASPSYLEVEAEVESVWQAYSAHVDDFVTTVASINIHSPEFADEFSSDDSWRDSGVIGLLGTIFGRGADGADATLNPTKHGPNGPASSSPVDKWGKRILPGRFGWAFAGIEIIITYLDEFQDSRSRVQIEHPEWNDAGDKGWAAFWETVVRGTARGTVNFGIGLIPVVPVGPILSAGELHVGDENRGKVDPGDAFADWLWELVAG